MLPVALLTCVSAAQATIITHRVDAMQNLYFDAWGHPYTETWDGVTRESNERSGINRGQPAEVVSNVSGAFNFAGWGSVHVQANGQSAINGTIAYGPDGVGGPPWRELLLYSLIGVWSTSDTGIANNGDPFNVGSINELMVPSGPSAYLFLAFNDGNYDDNNDGPLFGAGGYTVRLSESPIPEPASAGLIALGLSVLVLRRRRQRPRS